MPSHHPRPPVSTYLPSFSSSSPPSYPLKPVQCHLANKLLQTPNWASHPSPTTFALSWTSFAFASSVTYHIHRDDKYQDRILLVAVVCGILVCSILPERDAVAKLGRYMAYFVLGGLVISVLVHWVTGWVMGMRKEVQEQGTGLEKEECKERC